MSCVNYFLYRNMNSDGFILFPYFTRKDTLYFLFTQILWQMKGKLFLAEILSDGYLVITTPVLTAIITPSYTLWHLCSNATQS